MKKETKYDEIFDMPQEEAVNIMQEIEKKCLQDENYKNKLIANPAEQLEKAGIHLKPGIQFQAVYSQEEEEKLPENVFPLKINSQQGNTLSRGDLNRVVGGTGETDAGILGKFGYDNKGGLHLGWLGRFGPT